MKILGIDTSTKYLSIAIMDDTKVLNSFHEERPMAHFSLAIPTIDRLLKESGLKLRNIDGIALSIGPGSFTGLRIGVATCKGINLALGIPVVAVPTLDVIAYNFIDEGEKILCPVIDAKKQKLYTCFYKKHLSDLVGRTGVILEKVADYMLLDIESLLKKVKKPTLVFGDGVELYAEYLEKNPFVGISRKDWYPKAETVARIGLRKALKKQFANPDRLAPIYLHSKYCQVKK